MSQRLTAGLLAGLAMLVAVDTEPVAAQDAEGESTPVEAGEAVGDERVVVGDGHVDVGPRFVDGAFSLLIRDDTVDPSVWRRLPDTVLQVADAAVVEVPDDPTFSFLGQPGAQVWVLPQVQQVGILWPGWNTQDPEVATTLRREVTWSLTGVDGPGGFVLFVNEDFGEPAVIFDSREPFPQDTGIDLSTHAHGNWAFTAAGTYRLDVEMTATTVDGDEVRAEGTLQIAVGDATDPQDAFAASPPDTTARDEAAVDRDRAAPRESDSSSSTVWLGVGAAALAVVAAGGVLSWRVRRRPAGGA